MNARELTYLQRMGIDVWLPRNAVDAAAPAPAAPPQPEPAPRVEKAGADRAATAPDRDRAWEILAAEVADCQRCALRAGCTQTVFGVGDRRADLLVVGEGPGAEEDRRGEPFVGRAGALLDAMLHAIQLARGERVFIANVIKCRPPNNRDPRPEEVAACKPYLQRQIELLAPRAILALGRVAAQNLLGTDEPLGRLRSKPQRLDSGEPVIVTYHPAYLLRSPQEKAKAWQDLKAVRALLADTAVEEGARS